MTVYVSSQAQFSWAETFSTTSFPPYPDIFPALLLRIDRRNLIREFTVLKRFQPSFSVRIRVQAPFCWQPASYSKGTSWQDARTRLGIGWKNHLAEILVTILLEALDIEASIAGRRRHRQRIIRNYIAARLDNPDLTPQSIAQAHGTLARALYLLFEDEYDAISRWILERRLESAFRPIS